jgi:rod shape-determining protein MreD
MFHEKHWRGPAEGQRGAVQALPDVEPRGILHRDVANAPNVTPRTTPGATLASLPRIVSHVPVRRRDRSDGDSDRRTYGRSVHSGGQCPAASVFVFAVVWTIAIGLESGLVWAFVGGIALDVLAQRPFGTSSFALIVVVGLAAAIARVFIRIRPIVVVPAVALLSFVYSMTLFFLLGALGSSAAAHDPIGTLLPGVAYDTVDRRRSSARSPSPSTTATSRKSGSTGERYGYSTATSARLGRCRVSSSSRSRSSSASAG